MGVGCPPINQVMYGPNSNRIRLPKKAQKKALMVPHQKRQSCDVYHSCKYPSKEQKRVRLGSFCGLTGFLLLWILGTMIPNEEVPAYVQSLVAARVFTQRDYKCESGKDCEEFDETTDATTRVWFYGGADKQERWDRSFKWFFYIWHVANPRDVVENGARMQLIERGPYAYVRIASKFKVWFSEASDDIQFADSSWYEPMYKAWGEAFPTAACDYVRILHDNGPSVGPPASSSRDGSMNAPGSRASCYHDMEEVTVRA